MAGVTDNLLAKPKGQSQATLQTDPNCPTSRTTKALSRTPSSREVRAGSASYGEIVALAICNHACYAATRNPKLQTPNSRTLLRRSARHSDDVSLHQDTCMAAVGLSFPTKSPSPRPLAY